VRALLFLLALGVGRPVDPAYREALEGFYQGGTDGALARLAELSDGAPDDPIGPYLESLVLSWKIQQHPGRTNLDDELKRWTTRSIALSAARLAADPKDARAYLGRGASHGVRSRVALFRGRRQEAARESVGMREDLLKVRELDPDCKDALYGLGLYDYYVDVLPRLAKILLFFVGMPAGNRSKGLASIEASVHGTLFHGTEALARLYKIDAFYEKRMDKAYREIGELRSRYPGSPRWALELTDHECHRLGLYAESGEVAREILESAEAGRPNYAPVVGAMARVYWGDALLQDLRFAEAVLALLPLRDGVEEASWVGPRARYLLGRALELEGDREGALVHYRVAAASSDRDERRRAAQALSTPLPRGQVAGMQRLAEARRLRESGRTKDAARAFREALALWPDSQEAALRVAEDDFDLGRLLVARAEVEKLLSAASPYPPWVAPSGHLLLGRIHDASGERAGAVQEYKKVLMEPLGQDALRDAAAAGLERPFSRPSVAP
jgi:tetratricopeptide (TPR) repeat protein